MKKEEIKLKIMENSFEIRRIEEKDFKFSDKFIKLILENYLINFYNDENKFYDLSVSKFKDMKKFYNDGSAIIFVAFKDSELIGFLWAYRRDFLNQKRVHITSIIIDSKYRNYGIGKKLINNLENIMKKEEIDVIELMTSIENKNAIHFYEKYGFEKTRVNLEKTIF